MIRYAHNPIISPEDVKPSRPDFEVVCAFNPGVIRFGDEVILLVRVAERPVNPDDKTCLVPVFDPGRRELVIKSFDAHDPQNDLSDSRVLRTPTGVYLTSLSHLRLARSTDGVNFEIEREPALFPADLYEMYGVEDPRITLIDGTYYVNYSAISPVGGVTTCLASTVDFRTYRRHGVLFLPDNKDVAIFPARIGGRYYALSRPSAGFFQTRDIWISESPDLACWGHHRLLAGTRPGYWDDGRVGASAVPFRIKEGWLEIYHGASQGDRYCLGALLLDAEQPWRVLKRSREPVMQPTADYELRGFFGGVIFNCGVLYEDGLVKIYYGAADTCIGYAEIALDEILQNLESSP